MKTVSKKLLSLVLVAILLVSAIPFQAFADETSADETTAPETTATTMTETTATTMTETTASTEAHNENVSSHVSDVWYNDASNHWHLCPNANCELYGQPISSNPHSFSDGVCTVCGYACLHNGATHVDGYVAPTCVATGYSGDTVCDLCNAVIQKGTTLAATGVHSYVNYICSVCGAVETGASAQLTLDANGGTINGGASLTLNVNVGSSISGLADAVRSGYTFAGWWTSADGTGTQVYAGSAYDGSYTTLYAKWTEVTYRLTVRRLLNGVYSTAKTVYEANVPAGTPLLAYLNNNVSSTIMQELSVTPGYTWESNFWRDYSGLQPLTSQADCMNQAQTVYVNFVSKSYTLYFNANGGTVSTASKTVYFGSAVGTLPTATLSGKVFQGWKDVNGTLYTADTIYQIAGDTTLTAVWKDEALVILYVYINGNTSTCDRMIVMDQYVQNDNLTRTAVYNQIKNYYTASSGTLNIAGLFDEYTWSSYCANTSKAGVENIEIDSSKVNKIYIMVTNASTTTTIINGTTSTTSGTVYYYVATGTNTGYWVLGTAPTGSYWVSTGDGSGYWVYPVAGVDTSTIVYPTYVYVGTNPKTGDNSKIEVAAAVMVLAAAALIVVMSVRKKKLAR